MYWELHQDAAGDLHLVPEHERYRHALNGNCFCKPDLDVCIWHHRAVPAQVPGLYVLKSSIPNRKPAGALKIVGGTDIAP